MGTYIGFSNSVGATLGALLNQSYDPATDENLLMWIQSRSGLSLVDDKENNVSVLTPYLYFDGVDDLATPAAATNPTLFIAGISGNYCEAKVKVVTGERFIFFALGQTGHSYRQMIFEVTAAAKLRYYIRTGTITRDIISTDAIADGWHTLRVESTGSAFVFKVDGVTVNKTVVTGLDDGYWTLDVVAPSRLNIGSLTLSGGTTYTKGSVSEVQFGDTYKWICNNYSSVFEITTGLYTMVISGATKLYGGNSTHTLDKGYSIYTKAGSPDIEQPNKVDGTELAKAITGYVKSVVQEGNLTDHNLADSKMRFVNAFFDRSNATIWKDDARLGYYDAANTKDFHQSEINFKTLIGWLNDGYAARLYPKVVTNSITDRDYIDEILLVSDDRTLQDEVKLLTYTGDIAEAVTDESGNYVFDDLTGYVLIN